MRVSRLPEGLASEHHRFHTWMTVFRSMSVNYRKPLKPSLTQAVYLFESLTSALYLFHHRNMNICSQSLNNVRTLRNRQKEGIECVERADCGIKHNPTSMHLSACKEEEQSQSNDLVHYFCTGVNLCHQGSGLKYHSILQGRKNKQSKKNENRVQRKQKITAMQLAVLRMYSR